MGEHVWSGVNSAGSGKLAFAYSIPVIIVLWAVVRPGEEVFFQLLLIVFFVMWIIVTIVFALYGNLVFIPAQRRAEEEEAARKAMAETARAMKERAYADARKAEQERLRRTEEAYQLFVRHRARVRQEEAQFFQAFAAYRAQVDFHGTMDPAELRRGFASNLARFNLPLSGLYCDSLSPEVRPVLDMAMESPNPPMISRALKKRRSDGSPIIISFPNEEDAEAFARLDADEQWHMVATFTPRFLVPWSVRRKRGF